MTEPSQIQVNLPSLHADQAKAYGGRTRFYAVRCGRRWGKTVFGETIAADGATKGQPIGWFAPEHKFLSEAFNDLADILAPVKAGANKVEGVFRTITGGRIDFWSLENERAGRSRKYRDVIIDEAAFAKPNMIDIWRKSIRPTLLDLNGRAWVLSNTNGANHDNFLWRICNEPEHGFTEYHAPTHNNPYLPSEELLKLEAENHPLVYRQEYLAEFVDWSGVQFFALQDMLENGEPVAYPRICDGVFAVIDTALKTDREHDGTAVTFYALSQHIGVPLTVLDWDIKQIEGSLLEAWLPSVFQILEGLAKQCRARRGSLGAWIEDKGSGTILLQQARRRGWQARPIESKLTAMGKDERALNISGYVYRKMVKISQHAYDKIVTYHDRTRNHWLSQVMEFRVGVKHDTAEDDLLDTFCYGVAIALGDSEGY